MLVPILVAQAGLFYGFRLAPSMFSAAIMFTLMNTALRVANSYTIGEPLNAYGWTGVVLLCVSAILFRIK